MKDLLLELLAIPSPTFNEQKKIEFIKKWLEKNAFAGTLTQHNNNIIYEIKIDKNLPTIGLVGHCDVVPSHFNPKIEGDLIFGAGVSDMHAGFVSFLEILKKENKQLNYNVILIIYSQEEGTPLLDNGLYDLIQNYKQILKQIDLAIVGEPTDNTIQLGCVGSLHAKVTVYGKAAHSARPWDGSNALYNALPFINYCSKLKADMVEIKKMQFKDILTITECELSKGRTTVPDKCDLNINYRFSPNKSQKEAFAHIENIVQENLNCKFDVSLIDSVPSGKILSSSLLDTFIDRLGFNVEAKQAWTDVAQLSELGIPCFNFGPGFQSQAHTPNEHASLELIDVYISSLKKILFKNKGD